MAAPTRMLAREPHSASCDSQDRSLAMSSAPGIPAEVGLTFRSMANRSSTVATSSSIRTPGVSDAPEAERDREIRSAREIRLSRSGLSAALTTGEIHRRAGLTRPEEEAMNDARLIYSIPEA